jgi:hypothetical protein
MEVLHGLSLMALA